MFKIIISWNQYLLDKGSYVFLYIVSVLAVDQKLTILSYKLWKGNL